VKIQRKKGVRMIYLGSMTHILRRLNKLSKNFFWCIIEASGCSRTVLYNVL